MLFLSIQIVLGVIICATAVIITKKTYQFYLGALFVSYGALTEIVSYVFLPALSKWWPVYGMVAGLLLIVCGFLGYTKIKFGYFIPGFTLIGMGFWYALFSFNVINIPFLTVVGMAGPAFFLLIAILLIVFFCVQQKHKEFVFTDEDGAGDFSDEEPLVPQTDY